jgi:MauM/NapG family ferredoxin protein
MDRRNFIKNAAVTGAAAAGMAELGSSLFSRLFKDSEKTKHSTIGPVPLRPPGAVDEDEFVSRCIRCMRCADACPNNAIIQLGDSHGGEKRLTPTLKPRRQACMLCQGVEGDYLKCTEACPSGALQVIRKEVDEIRAKVDMGTAEIDLALCYSYNNWSCGACYRACPLPGVAMTLGLWERPEIVADACIGCGLCERACIRYPHAIRVKPRGSLT